MPDRNKIVFGVITELVYRICLSLPSIIFCPVGNASVWMFLHALHVPSQLIHDSVISQKLTAVLKQFGSVMSFITN